MATSGNAVGAIENLTPEYIEAILPLRAKEARKFGAIVLDAR
ncbi:hypothetical protein [Bradyrhizobium sp. WSM3983]|nr:hypothetical protein [Bradyrhizobium sp. WSM3983]